MYGNVPYGNRIRGMVTAGRLQNSISGKEEDPVMPVSGMAGFFVSENVQGIWQEFYDRAKYGGGPGGGSPAKNLVDIYGMCPLTRQYTGRYNRRKWRAGTR